MRTFLPYKTISWVFLLAYFLTGGTGNFSHCLKKAAHPGSAAGAAVQGSGQSAVTGAAVVPMLAVNQNGTNGLCPDFSSGPNSAAALNTAGFSGKFSFEAPRAVSSLPVASSLFFPQKNVRWHMAQPPPMVDPVLAHIRSVVLLT